jgi:transposase-like protein
MNEKPGPSNPAPSNGSVAADPEVSGVPIRRRFTAEYKFRIVKEADACKGPGEVGARLRREGLYSSLLSQWRRQREQGALVALGPRKRGRKSMGNPLSRRVAQLEAENRRLKRGLDRAHTILEIQKKASELLGIPLKDPKFDENAG